jgi:hypothetical protein
MLTLSQKVDQCKPLPAGAADGGDTSLLNPPVDSVEIIAKTASASPLGAGKSAREAPDSAEQRVKKKTRRKNVKNPFVEALKESEGGVRGSGRSSRGVSARDYEDLEDFIVCKPGRDYRRVLGLGGD